MAPMENVNRTPGTSDELKLEKCRLHDSNMTKLTTQTAKNNENKKKKELNPFFIILKLLFDLFIFIFQSQKNTFQRLTMKAKCSYNNIAIQTNEDFFFSAREKTQTASVLRI